MVYNVNMGIKAIITSDITKASGKIGETSLAGYATKEELDERISSLKGNSILSLSINGEDEGTFDPFGEKKVTFNVNVPKSVKDLDDGQMAWEAAMGSQMAVNSLSDVAFSGSYEDLSGKPTIPTKISDLLDDVSSFVTVGGDETITGKKTFSSSIIAEGGISLSVDVMEVAGNEFQFPAESGSVALESYVDSSMSSKADKDGEYDELTAGKAKDLIGVGDLTVSAYSSEIAIPYGIRGSIRVLQGSLSEKRETHNQYIPSSIVSLTTSSSRAVVGNSWGSMIGTVPPGIRGHVVFGFIKDESDIPNDNITIAWGSHTNCVATGENVGNYKPTKYSDRIFKGIYRLTDTMYGDGAIYYRLFDGLQPGTRRFSINLVDLTALYGDGNEPEIVEDFEKDHWRYYLNNPWTTSSTTNFESTWTLSRISVKGPDGVEKASYSSLPDTLDAEGGDKAYLYGRDDADGTEHPVPFRIYISAEIDSPSMIRRIANEATSALDADTHHLEGLINQEKIRAESAEEMLDEAKVDKSMIAEIDEAKAYLGV